MQGSCSVIQDGKKHNFNVIGRTSGQDRFFEIEKNDDCQYGYGVQSSCLDPYYTLAADLTIYKPGEVIFVPGRRRVDFARWFKTQRLLRYS